MSRVLRSLLLGSIAITFAYLIVHAREPLRLNVGDPWSDANVLTSINHVKSDGFLTTSFTDILGVGPLNADSSRNIHDPPLAKIFYGAVGKSLGISNIGTFRLFALVFSALAMWLLFSYVRRLYSDRIALISTALFTSNLLWMMYADSIHQAPVMQCTGFLALWGLVRAIETRQRRHYTAVLVGSFACFLTSYDYWLFLPAAALATIYIKAGNPFGRGNRPLVVLCALACILGIVTNCLIADLHLLFLERATSTHDRKFISAIPTMLRRITLVFTPFAWITVGFHVLKAIRAPTLASAIKGTAVWMLIPALAFLYLFAQLAASQMLVSQVLLPFYAIGSAVVLDRLLDGCPLFRRFALAWLVLAPLWSFYFMFTHPRSVLDRDDVAKTNAYLAANDHNDFLLSNLMSDGHIHAAFQRHSWAALDALDASGAPREMMRVFELTGADYVHEIIFTDPDSRFIDRSLWPLAMSRGSWSITGWPHLTRAKTRSVISEYDRRVLNNLKTLEATKVLQLSNFAVYRVDRATMMAILGATVPIASHIDFTSVDAWRNELLGWNGPSVVGGAPASSIRGIQRCPEKQCKTVLTTLGLRMPRVETLQMAQVMFRVDPVCDLRITFAFATPSYARFSIHGFTTEPMNGNSLTFTVPAKYLTKGVNIMTIEQILPRRFTTPLRVSTLDLTPACTTP